MVIVDLQDLEDQAQVSGSGVVLESEAVLLIVGEIRRLRQALDDQQAALDEVREDLRRMREMIALKKYAQQQPPRSQSREKRFSMTVGRTPAAPRKKPDPREMR